LPCRRTRSAIDAGEIPTLAGLGFSAAALRRTSTDATLALLGGERAAMDHVQAFIGLLASGKGARTPSSIRVGPAFSARVSPYLAIGCLSPRTVWHELSRGQGGAAGARPSPPPAAAGAGATGVGVPQRDGASWLLFELTGLLMWRDFFRFVSARLSTAATAATPARAAAAFAF
jgi:deoxyribodipyrimidine photolyase